jgi:tetratricopeptide (TPR) repeat protein
VHDGAGYGYSLLAWSHFFLGNYAHVFTFAKSALRALEHAFDLRAHCYALAVMSMASHQTGQWDKAIEYTEGVRRAAEELSDDSLVAYAHFIASTAWTQKGDYSNALESGNLAIQKAPTPADKVWTQTWFAFALMRAGEPRRSIELLTPLVPLYQASGTFVTAMAQLWLGEAYLRAEEFEQAKQTLNEALQAWERFGAKWWIASSDRLLGELGLRVDTDLNQAAAHLERSINILQEIRAENELALAYAAYGRLHKRLGDFNQAGDYQRRALEIFERLGTLREPDKVRADLESLSSLHSS